MHQAGTGETTWGRRRSVAITMLAAGMLMMRGSDVRVEHRHVHLARVLAPAA
jgi:hypothetical protein